jgi:hypothetical protein
MNVWLKNVGSHQRQKSFEELFQRAAASVTLASKLGS